MTRIETFASIESAPEGSRTGLEALAVAEVSACGYCLSAHTYLARNIAKLDDAEITGNRNAASNDPEVAAAVQFAAQVAQSRGHVGDLQVAAVRAAGFDDAQIVEIVQAVVLNTCANYVNEVARTEIDFPALEPLRAAA